MPGISLLKTQICWFELKATTHLKNASYLCLAPTFKFLNSHFHKINML